MYCPKHDKPIEYFRNYNSSWLFILDMIENFCPRCRDDYNAWLKSMKLYADAWKMYGSELAGPPDRPWLPGFHKGDRDKYIEILKNQKEEVNAMVEPINHEIEQMEEK